MLWGSYNHLSCIYVCMQVSMVGANLLKRVHERLAVIAGLPSAEPFAGISVLAVGDFQQLAPVAEPAVYKAPRAGYVALAELWMSNFKVFELKEIMRQLSDTTFAQLLGRLRIGQQTPADMDMLKSRQVHDDDQALDAHTHVFALNADVDDFNSRRLQSLPAPSVTIHAKDKWPAEYKDPSMMDAEKRSGLPSALTLKAGARVMRVRNVECNIGLYNGALGSVVGFMPPSSTVPTAVLVLFDNHRLQAVALERHPSLNGAFPVERSEARFPIRRKNAFVEGTRLQFPLRVAFALTIHKCQGQTLDSVVVNLTGYFGPGQAYVALSRCKTLQSLHITNFETKCLKVKYMLLSHFSVHFHSFSTCCFYKNAHRTWKDSVLRRCSSSMEQSTGRRC